MYIFVARMKHWCFRKFSKSVMARMGELDRACVNETANVCKVRAYIRMNTARRGNKVKLYSNSQGRQS